MCTGYVGIVRAVEWPRRVCRPRSRASAARGSRVLSHASPAGRWDRRRVAREGGRPPRRRPGRFIDDAARRACSTPPCCEARTPTARIVAVDARAALALPGGLCRHHRRRGASLSGALRPLIPHRPPSRSSVSPSTAPATSASPWPRWRRWIAPPRRTPSSESGSDYEPLPAVVDPEAAIGPDSPLLYPELGTNVVWHDTLTYGDVDGAMARADGVLRERFTIQRYASTPLETFGGIAEYDPGTDVFEFWTNDQRPGLTIASSPVALGGAPVAQFASPVRTSAAASATSAARLSRDLRAPRRKAAARQVDRGPHREPHALMHACNGVDGIVELAYRGRRHRAGAERRGTSPTEGKNLLTPTQHNLIKLGNIANGYRIPAIATRPGRPHQQVPERRQSRHRQAVHVLRRRAGDGAPRPPPRPRSRELRLRNLVTPSRCPYTTPPGAQYDSGDYPATLRRALESLRVLRVGRARAGTAGARGRGSSASASPTSVEPPGRTSHPNEIITGRRGASGSRKRRWCGSSRRHRARVDRRLRRAARATRRSSPRSWPTSSASRRTPVHVGPRLRLTTTTPWLYLSGNYSNKFSVTDVGPVWRGGAAWRDKSLRIAAHRLEIDAADLELRDGAAVVKAAPDRRLAWPSWPDGLCRRARPAAGKTGLEAATRTRTAGPADRCDRRVRSPARLRERGALLPRGGGPAHRVREDTDVRRRCTTAGGAESASSWRAMVHGSTVHGIGRGALEEFRYDERASSRRPPSGLSDSPPQPSVPTSRWTTSGIPRRSRRSAPRASARGGHPGPRRRRQASRRAGPFGA
jgi:hypothetical protein